MIGQATGTRHVRLIYRRQPSTPVGQTEYAIDTTAAHGVPNIGTSPDQQFLAQPGRALVRPSTTRKLCRSAHRSVTELKTDIRKSINERNNDPRPFT